jgi:hypothetical protein
VEQRVLLFASLHLAGICVVLQYVSGTNYSVGSVMCVMMKHYRALSVVQRSNYFLAVTWHLQHIYVPLVAFKSNVIKSIQINQPTECNSFTSLLLDVYVWLNMFRAPLRPSSGEYNCTRSLWFYRWSVVGRGLADHDQQRSNRHAPTVKSEAPSAVVSSWWWAARRPKHDEPHINVK